MARVLLTGGTGALAPSVARAFLDAGHCVRAMSRSGGIPSGLHGPIESFAGDINDAARVAKAVEGVDTVVHLAALLHARPGTYHHDDYYRTNVSGTTCLVRHAEIAGVSRIVLASSICVYPTNGTGMLDEHTVVGPSTSYAQTKVEAERVVVEARDKDGRAIGVVLRLAAVYGPQLKGNYRRLVSSLRRGPGLRIGSGENRRTLISEWDVARALLLAATHPAAGGQVYNVSDGGVHTINEIVAAINAALGKKNRTISLPAALARGAAGGLDRLLTPLGMAPFARQAVDKYVEDIAVDSSKFRDDLGFRAELNLADGWRRTVAEADWSGLRRVTSS
jgi:nucleoside-diphosphate-sugar epimerase